jgi:hypothetical protein
MGGWGGGAVGWASDAVTGGHCWWQHTEALSGALPLPLHFFGPLLLLLKQAQGRAPVAVCGSGGRHGGGPIPEEGAAPGQA